MIETVKNVVAVASKISSGEVLAAYATLKIGAAWVRAKAAKYDADVNAAAHKLMADAKGEEAKLTADVGGFGKFLWKEIKKVV